MLNKVKEYINSVGKLEKFLFLITTILFILFYYTVNSSKELVSNIASYTMMGYLLFVNIYFGVRRKWFLFIIHIVVFIVTLYDIFWFLFVISS